MKGIEQRIYLIYLITILYNVEKSSYIIQTFEYNVQIIPFLIL